MTQPPDRIHRAPISSTGLPMSRALRLLVLPLLALGCSRSSEPRVVLYCSQDREFAESLLDSFTRQTGFRAAVKFDTEADKSVGLYHELLRERNQPRCDVFWNNEIMNTIRLQRAGLLESYRSPSAEDFPDHAKASDGTWTAFAARARVLIVNTQRVPEAERPRSIMDLAVEKWRGRVAIARPLYGTTATHTACLFEVLGSEVAKEYFRRLKANDVRVLPGNKQVAEAVARGEIDVGFTDTDDAIIEWEAGRPVALVFPDREGHPDYPRLGTLYIPNTLMLIKGSPNTEGGRRLIDFLLSPAVEGRLAEGPSRQIPLNPRVAATLPAPIERPRGAGGTVKPMQVDFARAADVWDEAHSFIRNEFLRE